MYKKTKVIATIGPASCEDKIIRGLIKAGVDLFRFNLKHNTIDWHNRTIHKVNEIADEIDVNIGIIVDVPDPKYNLEINKCDFVAISFADSERTIDNFRKKIPKHLLGARLISKIENRLAIDNLKGLVKSADGVMIARGDLGISIPLEEITYWQKSIIKICREESRPVIVATEMLQSMTKFPKPTRAEATDVANAVFDGADALMLSEESAIGKYPIKAAQEMIRIASFCEDKNEMLTIVKKNHKNPTEVLVGAAVEIIENKAEFPIRGVLVFTQSGQTARILSSYRVKIPVVAISNDKTVIESLNLSYGVIPFYRYFKSTQFSLSNPILKEMATAAGLKTGDNVVVIHGNNWLTEGSTSNISLIRL